jgi:eukaryotic-like serine/threonine-protein kinase
VPGSAPEKYDDAYVDDPYYDDAPLGAHPISFLVLLGAVIAVVVLLASSFVERVGLAAVDGAPVLFEVREVIGVDAERASQLLSDDGFTVSITAMPNVQVEPGLVIDQRPRPGERVEAGVTVDLTVSAGADTTIVPDVRGSQHFELPLMLISHGLGLGDFTYVEDDRVINEVVDQVPAPGERVDRGTSVQVVLSSGPPMVEIPDVRDMPEFAARQMLRDAGFRVTVEDRRSHSVARGYAMSTDPDDEAPRGASVVLYISSGRPPATTTTTEAPTPTTTEPAGPSGSSRTVDGVITYEPFVG